jgi:hypothetical protein
MIDLMMMVMVAYRSYRYQSPFFELGLDLGMELGLGLGFGLGVGVRMVRL